MRYTPAYDTFVTVTMKPQNESKKTGRPLSFDREDACKKAMMLFWKYGFEGTSLNDLTAAIKVNPSSIYSAFGDKKGLFLAALEMYSLNPASAQEIIEHAETAREAAETMLFGAAHAFTGEDTPSGCFMGTAAISCSEASLDLQAVIAKMRGAIIDCLAKKIAQDINCERLPRSSDALRLAQYTVAVIQGMSTLARDGKARQDLLGVAEQAMTAWPRSLD